MVGTLASTGGVRPAVMLLTTFPSGRNLLTLHSPSKKELTIERGVYVKVLLPHCPQLLVHDSLVPATEIPGQFGGLFVELVCLGQKETFQPSGGFSSMHPPACECLLLG